MQTKILTDEQYKTLSKRLITTIEKHLKIIPLNTLKHSNYILKKPLYITVEVEKGLVIASLSDIEAFAYADTEFEAVDRLCDEIVNLYEDIIKDKENLGKLPQRWLTLLEEFIERK